MLPVMRIATGATILSDYMSILDRTTDPATPVPLLTIIEGVEGAVESSITYKSASSTQFLGGVILNKTVFLMDGTTPSDAIVLTLQADALQGRGFNFYTVTMYSDAGPVGNPLPFDAQVSEATCQAAACDITRLLFPEV